MENLNCNNQQEGIYMVVLGMQSLQGVPLRGAFAKLIPRSGSGFDLHPQKVTHLKSTGAKKVTVLEDKMESGNVPVEIRINAILDYEVRNLSKKAIARKYGVGESTVRGWIHTRDYFVNKCLEIAKIASEGKLNYFLDEEVMEQEEENPKDLAKQVKFLKQKVAYYEALAEECGLKLNEVSKKNDAEQSGGQQKNQEEN
jgi:transposase